MTPAIATALSGKKTAIAALSFAALAQTLLCAQATAHSRQWAWMNGGISNQTGQYAGAYGTLGVPAAGNTPGGREFSAAWSDAGGNFWLFGGQGADSTGQTGDLNDLWEFNPTTNEWAWISGSNLAGATGSYGIEGQAAHGNVPGAREDPVEWTDQSGNFWIFGGLGFDSKGVYTFLNDLWEFNPTTGLWTWMSGYSTAPPGSIFMGGWSGVYGTEGQASPSSLPGSREASASWIDKQGNLWMFGGSGFPASGIAGTLDDLWKYDMSSGEWAWVGGSKSIFVAGAYGKLGVSSASNFPGSHAQSTNWADSSGNFWLFGGDGNDATGVRGYMNDLWQFNPGTGEWTWISGSSILGITYCWEAQSECGQPDVYGTLGQPAVGNVPGGRLQAAGALNTNGDFWLFGGFEEDDPSGSENFLSDLWQFNPATLEWAWMSGSDTWICGPVGGGACAFTGTAPTLGTLGIPAATNSPGSQADAASWSDTYGNLWIFGGNEFSSAGTTHTHNYLWEFAFAAPTPQFNPPAGTYTSAPLVAISDATPGAAIYYTTDGSTPGTASTLYANPIAVSSGETIQAIAVVPGDFTSAVASATFTINLATAAAPTFSPAAGTYSSAQMVTISDTTPNAVVSYSITPASGNAPAQGPFVYTGPVSVSSSETLVASAAAANYLNSATASSTYTINLPNLPPSTFTLNASPGSLTIDPGSQGTINLTVTAVNGFDSAVTFACSGLPAGASCAFSPSTVTPPGTAATTLTIATTAQKAAVQRGSGSLFPGTALAIALCVFGLRRRSSMQRLALMGVAAVSLSVLCGCGFWGTLFGPPVVSTVTVTATSGSIQQSAPVILTVN